MAVGTDGWVARPGSLLRGDGPSLPPSRRSTALALLAALWGSIGARAQTSDDEVTYGASADADAPIPAAHDLDATAAGTEVAIRDSDPLVTLSDAVAEAPGTHVSQVGGFGAPSTVSLRGTDLQHTSIVLGDLPLGGPEATPVDLSLWSTLLFERVEVYRGGAPLWLDSGAIGGVLRLVPREGDGTRLAARLAAGSFGSYRLQLASSLEAGRVRAFVSAGAEGARNDFAYRYDNGTRFDASDDEDRHRVGAQTDAANGMANVQIRLPRGGSLQLLALGTSRAGGDPGPGQHRVESVRRNRVRSLGALGYTRAFGSGHRLQVATRFHHERHRFSDVHARLGPSAAATDDRTWSVWARLGTTLRLTPFAELSAIGSYGLERYDPSNALGPAQDSSQRQRGSVATELRLFGNLGKWRVALRPSARVEIVASRMSGLTPHLRDQLKESRTARPTFRMGALLAPLDDLAFTGSIARGVRFANTLELFGDRGVLLSNLALRPETARHADAGILGRLALGPIRLRFEARYFDIRVKDLIRYRVTSQQTARAENLSHATLRGAEAGTRGSVGQHLAFHVSATYLRARDDRDLDLSWRPRWRANARLTAHTRRLGRLVDASVWIGWDHRAAYFHDPANLVRISAAHWFEAGLACVLPHGFSASFRVRDLFDQRGQDFLGYPLPGRRVAALLHYLKDLDP